MLFTVADLTAMGLVTNSQISAISFEFGASAANACNGFTIRMGNTSNTALAGFVTGTTTVYGPTSFTPTTGTTGYVSFTLTTPFVWDGASNLVVETVHNAGNTGNGSGTTNRYTTTSTNTVYYGVKDNITPVTTPSIAIASYDAVSSYGTSGASANRPNVQFQHSRILTYAWASSPVVYTSSVQNPTNVAPTTNTTYGVTVSGLGGCTTQASTAPVTVNPLPAVTATPGAILCNGGNSTVVVAATGGTAPYTGTGSFTHAAGAYSYTVTDANTCSSTATGTISEPTALAGTATPGAILCNGGNSTVVVAATGGTAPYTGTGSFTHAAGAYSYTVTDANGCSVTLTGTISQPTALAATATPGAILCNGGNSTVVVAATGGTAPYTGTGSFTHAAGAYSYTVTDANGCSVTLTGTISQPTALAGTATPGAILCNGGNSTVVVAATGGTAPYTGTGSFTHAAGAYSYTVTDANGCSVTLTGTISQPTALAGTATPGAILCNGGNSTVVVAATGGTAPYTGTGSFTHAAGAYSYTVTDANGCSVTLTGTISQPTALAGTATPGAILCNGGNSTVVVTATGGTAPYTGTGSFTHAAGAYSYTVTDANGCSVTLTGTISEPTALAGTATPGAILCNGGNSTVVVAATGGTAPYTGTGSFTHAAGAYSYTVTDANGCSVTLTGTISQPTALAGTATPGAILCNGGNSTVVVAASGGTAPYTGTGSFTHAAGAYSYTVTDANGCSVTLTGTISQPTALAGTATPSAILCNGGNSTVVVAATGGTAPYTGTGSFTHAAGAYSYTVTDANGCSVTLTGTISEPTALAGTATPGAILCNGGNSTVVVAATGGTAPYTGTGSFTHAAGAYSYTVTDANGCSVTLTGTISQPTALAGTATPGAILCNGGNSTVVVAATGGTAPYTGTGSFTHAAGAYSYTVTDANGCSVTLTGTISQPTALAGTATPSAILCNGGNSTVVVAATGGTAPYTGTGSFTHAAGAYSYTVTDANGCSVTLTGTISQPTALAGTATPGAILCNGGNSTVVVAATGGTAPYTGTGSFTHAAGAYSYTVTDANGCSVTLTGTISQPTALAGTATPSAILCNGGNSTVVVAATGGTAPYTGTGSFTHAAGAYSYTVTDANGCSVTLTGTISQPTALAATATPGAILCNGGNSTVVVAATGGTAPYTGTGSFTHAAGAYSYTVTDANGCSVTLTGTISQPTALAGTATPGAILCNGGNSTVVVAATGGTAPYTGTGSFTHAAGAYSYTVTDANGCSVTLTGTISQPTALAGTATPGAILCNGGNSTVVVAATGGTAPYTGTGSFTHAAGAYSYTVTDANGCSVTLTGTISQPTALAGTATPGAILCNGGNSTVVVTATGGTAPYTGTGSFTHAAGAYSYTVTDANGCSVTLTGTISEPTALAGTATPGAILCNGGNSTVVVAATGGTAPYTGTGSFTHAAGAYSYTVTDANGCSVTLTGTISQPTALAGTATPGAILCNGGNSTVVVAASGGTAPYTGTGSFTHAAGAYSYTVTDANGCSVTLTGTISQPTALAGTATPSAILCNGGNSTVVVAATGGTAPYTGTGSFTHAAGAYSYTVTDANTCSSTATGTISQPTALAGTATPGAILCNGGNSTVVVAATGGTAPYTGTGSFTHAAGAYSYTVTDANGCSVTLTGTISQPTALAGTATPGAILCNGGNSTVVVAATGGTAPYTGTGSFTHAAGAYSYTVTDANGCSVTLTGTISQPTALAATATPGAILCNGGNSTVVVAATGGTAPYTGTGSFTHAAGAYSYTVTDANGCSVTLTGTISQPTALAGTATPGAILCNGGNSTVVVAATGGTAPYTGTGSFTHAAGAYSYTVTDANGCSVTLTGTISQPTALAGTATPGAILCNGGNSTVVVAATGGTAPYTGTGSFTHAAGAYSYTVTDANGCTVTLTGTISQPTALAGTATPSAILCNGGNSTVVVAATGGTAPYTGTGSFTHAAGAYSYTVTDANGCSVTLTGTISQPTALAGTATPGAILCNGGNSTVVVAATGGTAPYTGTGSFTHAAGAYSYTVTDANGCTVTLTGTISQPTALAGTATPGAILCNGGNSTVVVAATGGTAPYTGTGSFTHAAGVYSYTVTDANGCSVTLTGTISQPTALVASSTPGAAPCTGNTTTVTVSATGGTTAYTGTGLMSGVGAGPYSFTVTDANGCTSTTTGTITALPLPTPTITGLNAQYCVTTGAITTLVGSPAGGIFTVNGTPATTFDPTGLGVGTYSVAYTYTDPLTSCTGTTTQSVEVLAIPAAPVITSNAPSPLCLGNTVTITAPVTDRYAWYQDGAFLKWAYSPNNTLTVTASQTSKTYSLYIYSAGTNYCPSALSNPITIVGSAPAAVITPSAPAPYCVNTPPTLSANTGTGLTYSWICAACGTSTLSQSYVPTASGNYSVVVADANGCQKTSPNLNVTLNGLPPITAGVDQNVCLNGSPVNLGGSNSSNGYTYTWSPATDLSSTTAATPSVVRSTTAPITYTVTGTATSTGCVKTATVVVSVKPVVPTPTISATTTSPVCEGTVVNMTPTGTTGGIRWYKNGVLNLTTGGPSARSFVAATATPEYYTITAYDGACFSALSAAVPLMINAAPAPTITATPAVVANVVSICNQQTSGTAALVANIPTTTATVSAYNWQQVVAAVGSNVSPANTTSAYTAAVALSPTSSNNKIFRVQVNYTNGCSRNSGNVMVKQMPVGCTARMGAEESIETVFTAYPNPTSDVVNISLENFAVAEGELLLYNTLGQVVMTSSVSLTNGNAEQSLDLSSLAKGIYTVIFQSKDGQQTLKIVKE